MRYVPRSSVWADTVASCALVATGAMAPSVSASRPAIARVVIARGDRWSEWRMFFCFLLLSPPSGAAAPSDGAERRPRRGTGAGPDPPRTLVRRRGATAVTSPRVACRLPCPDGPDPGGQPPRLRGRARCHRGRRAARRASRGAAGTLRPLAASRQGPLAWAAIAARDIPRDAL